MDSKLVLIKSITLLYCENICDKIMEYSTDLIKDILSKLKLPEYITESDVNRNALLDLKDMAIWMVENVSLERFEYPVLLQRIRIIADDNYVIFQAFEQVERYQDMSQDALYNIILTLQRELKGYLQQWTIRNIIQKAHKELFYSKTAIDWQSYVSNLISELEVYSSGWTQTKKEYLLENISMNDPDAMMNLLVRAVRESNATGGFKTGWQGFNRMLGETGQISRGNFVLIGGITHNYKSGMAHDLFRHLCRHNIPIQEDKSKIPTLLFYICENKSEKDIFRMYRTLKESEEGILVDPRKIDPREANDYIRQKLTEHGWYVEMRRIDGEKFSHKDLFTDVIEFIGKGHEIHAIGFDYLALIRKDDLGAAGMVGEDTRRLVEKVRKFMIAKNILFFSPHQLSTEADYVKSQVGNDNFLQKICKRRLWDAGKRVANEVDLEIFVNIVERDGKAFLNIARGKHRGEEHTPLKDQNFYLPFTVGGYIPDDVGKKDSTIYDLTQAEGGFSLDF